ncbi:GTPase ObgE [Candidatus Saccharibacteria bacterium]|nr:GTPase ObgE [Candidatus Saccharibacteria bacterium]
MSFVDSAKIMVTAGKGGDGVVSFRHEIYVDKGGPDGGDGGRGGDVVFVASRNVNTLDDFRYKQEIKAEDGEAGSKRRRHGKSGRDVTVKVPVGTAIVNDETGETMADLAEDEASVVLAKGGRGGFGNAHFTSSTRQAPRVAELGEEGEVFELRLELKLLADVGLVGLPNAGKSTFLSSVSHARPEVADYPFTTLVPHLGVATIDETSLLIADIPGLIEGASEGKGLGDRFLRHVERTAVLLHLIDAYSNDAAETYQTIRRELAAYGAHLAERPEVIALTKTEGLDDDIIAMQQDAIRDVAGKDAEIFAISSHSGHGVKEVLRLLRRHVETVRKAEAERLAAEKAEQAMAVIELDDRQQDEAWQVREEDGAYIVTGAKIERFAARTDFANIHGVIRLRDILRKMGIRHELERMDASPTATIYIGDARKYRLTMEDME